MNEQSIPELAELWGVQDCTLAAKRFAQPGWSYEETLLLPCPNGHTTIHVARKPFEHKGKQLRYVALICPDCAHAYEMRDVGVTSYSELRNASSGRGARPQQVNSTRAATTSSSRRSRMKYEPTPEQQAVIEAAGAGKHLVVQAGAGAVRVRPDRKDQGGEGRGEGRDDESCPTDQSGAVDGSHGASCCGTAR